MRLVLRSTGWLLIAAGTLVALYLVYALYWTGRGTADAQQQLLREIAGEQESFELEVGDLEPLEVDGPAPAPSDQALDVGDAVAVIRFHRPGASTPVVIDTPLVVVEGVTEAALQTGPGRYPHTSYPGEVGNFAVAGHRTTYGAPFWNLDQLREGDEIHVTDRTGATYVYAFREQRIVPPSDVSVLRGDPLGTGRPTLTLTTCHPRWSQRERMVVLAELVGEPAPDPVGA
jgi:sortase A